jgi:hypothetical protein
MQASAVVHECVHVWGLVFCVHPHTTPHSTTSPPPPPTTTTTAFVQ